MSVTIFYLLSRESVTCLNGTCLCIVTVDVRFCESTEGVRSCCSLFWGSVVLKKAGVCVRVCVLSTIPLTQRKLITIPRFTVSVLVARCHTAGPSPGRDRGAAATYGLYRTRSVREPRARDPCEIRARSVRDPCERGACERGACERDTCRTQARHGRQLATPPARRGHGRG